MFIRGDINALSDFRVKRLLAELKKLDVHITGLSAEYVHMAATSKPLTAPDRRRLEELLLYGKPFSNQRKGELFLVVPRPGTKSSWSSKATDIAHNCGLNNIRRIERGIAYYIAAKKPLHRATIGAILHDRMTETVLGALKEAETLFQETPPRPCLIIDVLNGGKSALINANASLGLAMSDDEIVYLYDAYQQLKRNPTDAELMMFAQVNSEHCRHKIFNADWIIDGEKQSKSLFKMIRNTYEKGGGDVLSAYSDNAAVLKGPRGNRFFADPDSDTYRYREEPIHLVTKVETHNHPTAIAPNPGAATGVGGEIRDEGATGLGAKPKMGLTGFSVSNLYIPGAEQPWESAYGKPGRIAAPLDIMIQAPLGGAAYNNEFGRPNLAGYFRTYEQEIGEDDTKQVWGYHKPIMVAGGLANIRDEHVIKGKLPVGALVIILGGPSMLIGLGGASGSSMNAGQSNEELDFASVQRANAEMERRVQEVINSCWAMGRKNPIVSIHDVGAGGISNGLPELVHDAGLGATFELRKVPNAEPGMSPAEIWCNEAQERYVLGIKAKDLPLFEKFCSRERCPFAVVGKTTKRQQLTVTDSHFSNKPIELPMAVLFGKPPRMVRSFKRTKTSSPAFKTEAININEAVKRILHIPAVASKKFLITIGDRTVGGLTVRDQMVGPWQVPVSDVAVTASSYDGTTGEAMAMGERSPLGIIDSPASGRMAVGEALTNIAAAPIDNLSDVKLSANWMAAAGFGNEDQKLFDTVKAIGEDFCPSLGITIPVGKDSLSMRTTWQEKEEQKSVTSPVSLIITAFAPVTDITRVLTPQLVRGTDSRLIYIDLGEGRGRMGGSALAQAYNQVGDETPDANPKILKKFFATIQKLNQDGQLLAYHDRADGGLFTTVVEMAFAGRMGLDINLEELPGTDLERLFNEELGAVIQVRTANSSKIITMLQHNLGQNVFMLGAPTDAQQIVFRSGGKIIYKNTRANLETWWSATSHAIQMLRDNPVCAQEEMNIISDDTDAGLSPKLTFASIPKTYERRPRIAILREQGVNGQVEMAAAFDKAGFTAVDVYLNDILNSSRTLAEFNGLVACGGFSYGDVLGAGEGWAKSILFNPRLSKQFQQFFTRKDTFSLGICNGCQMLSNLRTIIPGAQHWPNFLRNDSEQFEARLVSVRINKSPSILFRGMEGSIIPLPVAHGEGKADFSSDENARLVLNQNLAPLQYVNNYGSVTTRYPFNPGGSLEGITGLTSVDGRATIMMPHPERAFLTKQYSWHPEEWGEEAPWFRMFQNAREWLEDQL